MRQEKVPVAINADIAKNNNNFETKSKHCPYNNKPFRIRTLHFEVA